MPIPPGEPDALSIPAPEPARPVVTAFRALAPALVAWSVLDEARYRLSARCQGQQEATVEWTAFVAAAREAGLLEPVGAVYRVRPDRVPPEPPAEPDAVRARLVECWLAERDPATAPEIATWAAALARWDVVEETWMAYNGHTGTVPPDALRIYRDLPPEARKERPFLTWAAAAAAAALASSPQQEVDLTIRQLLLDAAMLHTDWSTREDTDAAVIAGSLRMLGERRLPSTRPGHSLEAAWRTKQEVDAFIDARSRQGRGPGRRSQALFRTFSSRLAMARADAAGVLSEARWASVLADWEPLQTAAQGLVTLAFGVLGMPAEAPKEKLGRLDDELGVHGLRGMGQSYSVLADAFRAVWALDRPELERTLALVSTEAAAIVGAWSLRVTAHAFLDGLWGNPAEGLDRLSADILRVSVLGREQDEPLGSFVIARSRLLLMTRAGAFGAAREVLGSLSKPTAVLPHARLLLWSGQLQRAIEVVQSSDYDDRVDATERHELTLIKAGAALLLGACDAALKGEAVRAVGEVVASEDFFSLASLPRPAREALIGLCDPEMRGTPEFRLLERRLAELNDASDQGVRPVRLTSREKLLLPLLATDASVPDIARSLHVSVNTVRKQVVTLREKFGADTRAELVRRARNFGALS